MKKELKLRIDEQKAQQLKANAAAQGKSLNAFCEDILSKDLKPVEKIAVPEKQEKSVINMTLSAEEMNTLCSRANEAGMKPRDYIRSLIANEYLVKVDIVTEDFDELLDAMYTFTKTFNALMAPIQRSGAFAKDVEKLVALHTELNNTVNKIYIEQRDMRNQLYQETRKKILEDIRDYTYRPRKRKGGE